MIGLMAASLAAQAQAGPAAAGSDPSQSPFAVRSVLGGPEFQAEWRAYAAKFLAEDGRIVDNANNSISHSEGQGYGLLIAAFAKDSEAFARIWRWTQTHLQTRDDHLLSWRWDPKANSVTDANNATDGDILVAWALLRGARTFGQPEYRDAAREIVESLGDLALIETPLGPALLPGVSGFGVEDQKDGLVLNPSYWVFPALADFAELDPRHDWKGVEQTGLSLLARSRFGARALPGEWISLRQGAVVAAADFTADFSYNAIRIPLYLSWSGDAAAKRELARFAALWRTASQPEILSASGAAPKPFVDAGYAMVASLTRCAAGAGPIDVKSAGLQDPLYYPATLRMLSVIVLQERYPKCL